MLTNPHFSPARLASVRERIERAAVAAGRLPHTVTLIGVSKTQPAEAVQQAVQAGLGQFGENYLQEAVAKIAAVGRDGITWHFIGHLQSNKTRPVADSFDWVHTLDRLKLAERLNEQRPFHGPRLNVCLQVNIGEEASKGGCHASALPALAEAVAQLPRLHLRGLMCIPPECTDPSEQRRHFATLRGHLETLNRLGHSLDTLSMGMSADLEAAILEGATHVRIGSALFGERMRA